MTIDELLGLIATDGYDPPGAADVAAFEAENGLTLPDDYRAFLAATAGGQVRGLVRFSLAGEEDGSELLSGVFSLGFEGPLSVEERLAKAEDEATPAGLLPIMVDVGGNAIAIVLWADRFGEMVFLDHEVADVGRATPEAAEAEDWGYAFPFAPSFTAMVAGFTLRAE